MILDIFSQQIRKEKYINYMKGMVRKMKALLIGGTGTISMDITRLLSQMDEW